MAQISAASIERVFHFGTSKRLVKNSAGSGLEHVARAGPDPGCNGEQNGFLSRRKEIGHAQYVAHSRKVEVHQQRGASSIYYLFKSLLGSTANNRIDSGILENRL